MATNSFDRKIIVTDPKDQARVIDFMYHAPVHPISANKEKINADRRDEILSRYCSRFKK